jgi:hypothetical protein
VERRKISASLIDGGGAGVGQLYALRSCSRVSVQTWFLFGDQALAIRSRGTSAREKRGAGRSIAEVRDYVP